MYGFSAEIAGIYWIVIAALILVVGVAVFFGTRKKEVKKIDGDKAKSLAHEKLKKVEPEEYNEKKGELSLAEIKASKSLKVEDRSKEEMRQLRQERRAKEQTEASKDKLDRPKSMEAFTSLFGDVAEGGDLGMNMDMDIFDDGSEKGKEGSAIPTLGSGMVNLDSSDKKKD